MSNVDWLATRNEIIARALNNLGVVPLGEDPTPEQQKFALDQLNSTTKFLQTKQLFLWNYGEEEIALVHGQAAYTFVNNDAIGIDEAYYLKPSTSERVFLTTIDQPTYFHITDQAITSGLLDKIYFERGVSTPKIYLYPKPDLTRSDMPTTIKVRVARRLQDWDSASGDVWPAWWVEPLVWRLTADLSHVFRAPLQERAVLEAKANGMLGEAFSDNWRTHDRGDIAFTPD